MEVFNARHKFHTELQMPQANRATLELQEKLIETKEAYRSLHLTLGQVWTFANRNVKCKDEAFVPSPSTAENLYRLRALLATHSEWNKPGSTVASTVALLCNTIQGNMSSAIHTIDELLESRIFLFV
jgi:hypothetical protein